jgi:two-component system, OmpR family, sensor kinase
MDSIDSKDSLSGVERRLPTPPPSGGNEDGIWPPALKHGFRHLPAIFTMLTTRLAGAGAGARVVKSGERAQPRSLRLRLALWYGTLVALALSLFAVLVLIFASDAIERSVNDAVQAEARAALVDVRRELLPAPPYFPTTPLTLSDIDTLRDPGSVVVILDANGAVRYRSTTGAIPTLSAADRQSVLSGGTVERDARIEGQPVRLRALPLRAPVPGASGDVADTDGAAADPNAPTGPIAGVLLVGKSLSDVRAALALLRTLILVIGLLTLAAALAGGWAIAARVLRPLAEIGATARAIAAASRGPRLGSLSRRVRRPAGNDEMAQVVDTLNEMLAALESASATQRRFVADASHELRAPLTTIQGNLAFLQRHADELPPAERRTMLADAHGETLRLARLVDDLLMLARADATSDALPEAGAASAASVARAGPSGAQSIGPAAPVELDHAILQLVRQLRGRLTAEGSRLTLRIGTVEPVRVRADEETLRRVALILLDNAIKYTPTDEAGNGAHGVVTVSIERAGAEAVLRVRDTGPGIAPEDLPHIFERFYRADPARDRQGTGLGLAIAQALVERLGGRLTAESAPGQGSTFSVWLPLV